MPSNKKVGNDFEATFCEILFNHGFWVHNIAQNQAGQPADVIAVRNKVSYLIDCKVCSTSKGFTPDRMEDNQDLSMRLWEECGNGEGWFAILFADEIYMIPHLIVDVFAQLRYTLSPKVISTAGKPLDEWMKSCR